MSSYRGHRLLPIALLLVCLLLAACGARISRATLPATATSVAVTQLSGQACAGPPAPAPRTGSDLATVGAAYRDLLSVYFRPLDPASLLSAAWHGATGNASLHDPQLPLIAAPQFSGQQPDIEWQRFAQQYSLLSQATQGKVDQVDLAYAAVAAMAASVHEGHTYFVPPDAFAQEGKAMQLSGIGVQLTSANGRFVIVDVLAGSPADRAGVKPGDTFLSVDGCNVQPLNAQQLHDLVDGPAGTPVKITFGLPAGGMSTFTITREIVTFPVLTSKVLAGNIGYIKLTSFPSPAVKLADGHTIVERLDSVLASFQQAGITGWILDLRGNPGGLVDGLQAVAGQILPSGTIFSFAPRHGKRIEERTVGSRVTNPPLRAVLVNSGTASAAEILSSAIQEEHVATIVGTPTAGVANGAELVGLPGGAGLSITHFQTFTVDGTPLNGAGVTPSIIVQLTPQDLASGNDPQLQRALQVAGSG